MNKYKPRPTKVKKTSIAEHIQSMHDKWLAAWRGRNVVKQEPNPDSISSIKKELGVSRAVVREHLRVKAAARHS